jgi:hypothetical protein
MTENRGHEGFDVLQRSLALRAGEAAKESRAESGFICRHICRISCRAERSCGLACRPRLCDTSNTMSHRAGKSSQIDVALVVLRLSNQEQHMF